jgi:hypothetical protein
MEANGTIYSVSFKDSAEDNGLDAAEAEPEVTLYFSMFLPVTHRAQAVRKACSHHVLGVVIAQFQEQVQGLGKLGELMEKQWVCVSCISQIELDTHGRCSTCGSDAVDRVENGAFLMIQQEHTNGLASDRRELTSPNR